MQRCIKFSVPSQSPVAGSHDAPLNPIPRKGPKEEVPLPGDPQLLVMFGPQGQASRSLKLFPTPSSFLHSTPNPAPAFLWRGWGRVGSFSKSQFLAARSFGRVRAAASILLPSSPARPARIPGHAVPARHLVVNPGLCSLPQAPCRLLLGREVCRGLCET